MWDFSSLLFFLGPFSALLGQHLFSNYENLTLTDLWIMHHISNCGRKKVELGKMVGKPRQVRTEFLMKRIFCRKEVERGS